MGLHDLGQVREFRIEDDGGLNIFEQRGVRVRRDVNGDGGLSDMSRFDQGVLVQ